MCFIGFMNSEKVAGMMLSSALVTCKSNSLYQITELRFFFFNCVAFSKYSVTYFLLQSFFHFILCVCSLLLVK